MERELYQLVAISTNGLEYVIELENENKNNRSKLEFIESGTCRFQNQEHLANYLYQRGKIPTKKVSFAIKYKREGIKYIPIIYQDKNLHAILNGKDGDKYYQDYVFYLLKQIEIELDKGFYNYLITENERNRRGPRNGNYLNNKLMSDINVLFNQYIITKNIDADKSDIEYGIVKELFNYKQFRTMHMYFKNYMLTKNKNINVEFNHKEEKYQDIPDDIRYAYEKYGMDGVWAITDLDDLADRGIKLR